LAAEEGFSAAFFIKRFWSSTVARSMTRRLLTFTGADRPGLIAAIARVLSDLGADIEDVSMTRLSGNFALMLLARGGDLHNADEKLHEIAAKLGLHCHIDDAVEEVAPARANLFVSVVGPNKVGIVATIAETLAKHGANIVEMATRLLEKTEVPVYLVRLEAQADCNLVALEQDLLEAARKIGVEARVEPIEAGEL
jgi:glycine cleavage system transcriptional repressor